MRPKHQKSGFLVNNFFSSLFGHIWFRIFRDTMDSFLVIFYTYSVKVIWTTKRLSSKKCCIRKTILKINYHLIQLFINMSRLINIHDFQQPPNQRIYKIIPIVIKITHNKKNTKIISNILDIKPQETKSSETK